MLSVICFSKDRPMQLHAYIESLLYFGLVKPEMIKIIYHSSPEISYEGVRSAFPSVHWIAESTFHDDLVTIVKACNPYILWGCDDVVFKEYFDFNDSIVALAENDDVFGQSLRLGGNLKFLPMLRDEGRYLTWDWRAAKGEYWSYPWEVSASIYRRDTVLALIGSRPELSNPNRLEAYLAQEIAAGSIRVPPRMACFRESCCLTVTVNRVQDEYPNAFDDAKDTGPVSLARDYAAGKFQDWPRLAGFGNGTVHVGADAFSTTTMISPPPRQYEPAGGSHKPRRRQLGLTLRYWWWKVGISVWEMVRSVLPRSAITMIRRVLRG